MVLRLIEEKQQLDEVIFYDTGMEFQSIYSNKEKMKPILIANGIEFTELKSKEPFLYMMFDKPIKTKSGRTKNGYGWCGGVCRWGTGQKIRTIDKYVRQKDVEMYVGIAADEQYRMSRKRNQKETQLFPLIEWGMTEADCLRYCRERGWNWDENGIDLYDILKRVSCWCCRNKNRSELYAIYKYLPDYWERLKQMEARIGEPMKCFHNREYGDYGSLFDMENVFKLESENEQMTLFCTAYLR